jgi:hypothetical protein
MGGEVVVKAMKREGEEEGDGSDGGGAADAPSEDESVADAEDAVGDEPIAAAVEGAAANVESVTAVDDVPKASEPVTAAADTAVHVEELDDGFVELYDDNRSVATSSIVEVDEQRAPRLFVSAALMWEAPGPDGAGELFRALGNAGWKPVYVRGSGTIFTRSFTGE